MCASCLQNNEDLVKDLPRRFSGNTKYWIYIRVIAASFSSNEGCKFYVVDFPVTVRVKFAEKSLDFIIFEYASECLERFLELNRLNSTEAIEVKMLKDLLRSLSLIIGAVSALSDLLENCVLQLRHALSCNLCAL